MIWLVRLSSDWMTNALLSVTWYASGALGVAQAVNKTGKANIRTGKTNFFIYDFIYWLLEHPSRKCSFC